MRTLALQLLALVSVGFAAEVCYPPCGCFNDSPPFNDRPLPESYEMAPIAWLLYTRRNRDSPQAISFPNVGRPSFFDASKPTEFLIHGWNGGLNSLAQTRDAILDAYDHNVIVVDWSVGASRTFYPQSASTTQVVGACSAYVAKEITSMGSVHCIGHSLGGQTCGYMGARSQPNGSPTMKRATGLDPAGPWFDVDDARVRIDKSDALFVDNIHTNGEALGLGKPVATADFFPNKGDRQPGCSNGNCDHGICKDFFAASISARSSCNFNAYPCTSKEDADAGRCNSCSGSNCQKMGWFADTMPGEGPFFLRTVAGYPYCAN